MNLSEMNREQLMQFLTIAQPDMYELEKLNSELNQERKNCIMRNAHVSSMPKHITVGRVVGAIFASFGIAILFYIVATYIKLKAFALGFDTTEYIKALAMNSSSPFKLLPSLSDIFASGFWFLIPFLVSLTIIIVITNMLIIKKRKRALLNFEKEKEIFKEVNDYYKNKMSAIHSNHPEWRMIPEAYQSAEVLYGIYNYLRDMRANNWKEAANLYEFEHPGRTLPNYTFQIY